MKNETYITVWMAVNVFYIFFNEKLLRWFSRNAWIAWSWFSRKRSNIAFFWKAGNRVPITSWLSSTGFFAIMIAIVVERIYPHFLKLLGDIVERFYCLFCLKALKVANTFFYKDGPPSLNAWKVDLNLELRKE